MPLLPARKDISMRGTHLCPHPSDARLRGRRGEAPILAPERQASSDRFRLVDRYAEKSLANRGGGRGEGVGEEEAGGKGAPGSTPEPLLHDVVPGLERPSRPEALSWPDPSPARPRRLQTVYKMMLTEQKENLHGVCATWFETHHRQSPTSSSIIMHHWLRSGNNKKKARPSVAPQASGPLLSCGCGVVFRRAPFKPPVKVRSAPLVPS